MQDAFVAESLHENKAIKVPFTPCNWCICIFLLLLCRISKDTTFILKTFSVPLNFSASVEDDKWWPLCPWGPTQNKAILCPAPPEAHLRLEQNLFETAWPSTPVLQQRFLLMYVFWGQKILLVPLTGLYYYAAKEPWWVEAGTELHCCWWAE